jgi:hypothetical protein
MQLDGGSRPTQFSRDLQTKYCSNLFLPLCRAYCMSAPNTITDNGKTYKLLYTSSTQSGIQHFKKGHGPGYWRYKTTSKPALINGRRGNIYFLYGYRDWEYEEKQTAKLRQSGYLRPESKKRKQIGTSNPSRDKARTAKPPGKRTSKKGLVYFENRKNRSDLFGGI